MRRFRQGFTLVEILVVLVMVALISSILLQALERSFRLQQRFGLALFASQQGGMAADWFRQSIEGLQPDYADGKDKFTGSATRIAGVTTNPMSTDYGALASFSWELGFDADSGTTQLIYTGAGRRDAVLAWRGQVGRFSYLDAKDEIHDDWPPPFGRWPQLPRSVRLEGMRGDEALVLVASPQGPTKAPPRVQDLFGPAGTTVIP